MGIEFKIIAFVIFIIITIVWIILNIKRSIKKYKGEWLDMSWKDEKL